VVFGLAADLALEPFALGGVFALEAFAPEVWDEPFVA